MSRFLHYLIVTASVVQFVQAEPLSSRTTAQKQADNGLQLTLPPFIYAVPGVETNLYFDNVVVSQHSKDLQFVAEGSVGDSLVDRWKFVPGAKDIGEHVLKIEVSDVQKKVTSSASTVVRVLPPNAGSQRDRVRLLIIGDSLTHASAYANEVARLLSLPGNPKWKMLGTHKPAPAAEGVIHEGYGGWTWQRFVSKYEPNPDGTHRKRSSPFVFLNKQSRPELNVTRYFDESCGGERPDFIIIMLGINDCFSAPPDDVEAIDVRIDAMFVYATKLRASIRQAAPKTHIGICLTTPPNSRQAAFEANYKDRYSRWGWKRIQHRLVQRQIEFVATSADEKISLIPTQLNLDPVDGYPPNNGVHPNKLGYDQIGSSIYCWLKWRFTQDVK